MLHQFQAYFSKPGGKSPLNLKLFLSYVFVTRPLLNILWLQRGPLTFGVLESPLMQMLIKNFNTYNVLVFDFSYFANLRQQDEQDYRLPIKNK